MVLTVGEVPPQALRAYGKAEELVPGREPLGPTGHWEVTPAPCPVDAHPSAPASLPQSPPAAKPGPHLGVISCLTSSRLMASLG